MDAVRKIAQAVLYEGYVLWPYRRSALKNRMRWTFGCVLPRRFADVARNGDACEMQTQCLLEAERGAQVDVRLRFLHVVERQVFRDVDGQLEPVDAIDLGAESVASWEEAVEREIACTEVEVDSLDAPRVVPFAIDGGSRCDDLLDADGRRAGAVVRRWNDLRGRLAVRAERVRDGVRRVEVRVSNETPWTGAERPAALRRALVSTHVLLEAQSAAFVSMTDPPEALRAHAAACRNAGAWPVLVGEPGDRSRMLASPIVLEDYPRVADESPGDLFDGAEIDELLILNVLALGDEEKREMAASDPLARRILERCSSLGPEERLRLHGALRGRRPITDP